MADQTNIEWCDSSFNPWQGCTKVSPGCDHCYAEARQDTRLHVVKWGAGQPRKRTSEANWHQPVKWNGLTFVQCEACGWRGDLPRVGIAGECPACGQVDRYQPARRRVFCASLADVFDNAVPSQWRADLLMLIRATPNLDWLLLTKRIGNVTSMLAEAEGLVAASGFDDAWDWVHAWTTGKPPSNVWLGATIVNQLEADRDIPKLLAAPARVRFLSMEPLLGPVNLSSLPLLPATAEAMGMHRNSGDRFNPLHPRLPCRPLDWVIAGGESGHGARPSHPDWFRSLRDQCATDGVPFLFKQHGEWAPLGPEKARDCAVDAQGRVAEPLHREQFPKDATAADGWTRMYRVGKKAAGRLLDGRTHDGFPETTP